MDQRKLQVVIESDTDKADKGLSSFGDSLKNVGTIAGGILLSRLTEEIVNFGREAIFAGVQTATFYENAKIGFTTLLGSAEKANAVITQIKKDALATPLDASSLVEANKMLLSTGMSADKARADILNLGKAVVATGGGNAELSRMAVNLQQISNVGKATALDIKQFAFAGINIYQLLADATGKNVKEVKDMDVSYELLSKALAKAGNAGGRFANAFTNAGGSMMQITSNLKEAFNTLFADIITDSGAFDVMKKAMLDLSNAINQAKPAIVASIKAISEFFVKNGDAIISAIVGITGALIYSLVAGITISQAAIVAFLAAAWPLVAVAVAVGAAFYILKSHFGDLQPFLDKLGDKFERLGQILQPIFDMLEGRTQRLGQIISPVFQQFTFYLERSAQLAQLFANYLAFGTADAGGNMADLLDVLTGLYNRFEALASILRDAFTPLFNNLTLAFAAFNEQVQTQLGPAFANFTTALQPLVDILGPKLLEVFKGLAIVFATVLTIFLALVTGIITGLTNALPYITMIIEGIIQVFTGLVELVTALITGDWSNAWNIAVNILSGVKNIIVGIVGAIFMFIKGFVEGVVQFFSGLFKTLIQLTDGGLQELFQRFSNILEAIKGTVNGWKDAIIGAFNAVKNAIKGAIDAFNEATSKGVGGFGKRSTGGFASGMTLVGENGPEVVNLPTGSYVNRAVDSKRMMGGSDINVNFNNVSVRNDSDLQSIIEAVENVLGRKNELAIMGAL